MGRQVGPLLRGRSVGRTAILPSELGESLSLLDLTGDDEEPCLVTLALQAYRQEASAIGQALAPVQLIQARVAFGTGGASAEALVTINRGVVLTLPATSLRVSVKREGDAIVRGVPGIVVTGFAAYGARSSSPLASGPFYETELELDAGAQDIVPIPPFAGSFGVVAEEPLTSLEAENANNGPVQTFPVSGSLQGLVLPSRASFLRVASPTAQLVRFFFGLNL